MVERMPVLQVSSDAGDRPCNMTEQVVSSGNTSDFYLSFILLEFIIFVVFYSDFKLFFPPPPVLGHQTACSVASPSMLHDVSHSINNAAALSSRPSIPWLYKQVSLNMVFLGEWRKYTMWSFNCPFFRYDWIWNGKSSCASAHQVPGCREQWTATQFTVSCNCTSDPRHTNEPEMDAKCRLFNLDTTWICSRVSVQ